MDPEIWDALPKAVEWIFPLTSVISRARINCELDMQMKQVAIKVAWRPVGRSDAKGMKAFDLEGWEEDFEYHTLQKKGEEIRISWLSSICTTFEFHKTVF